MINTKRILITIEGTGKDPFEANYAIIKERVHIYISRVHVIRGYISKAFFKEVESEMEALLFDCQLTAVGEEYDEYVAKKAVVNEGKLSYSTNLYTNALFTLSNDLLRFFDSVWKIVPVATDRNSNVLTFNSIEDRVELVQLTENIAMSIKRGYKQSYSKIRYEAHSSIVFFLHFKNEVPRETSLALIQSVADFYSLFCKNFIRIGMVRLQPNNEEKQVSYLGEPAGDVTETDYFSNPLIEQQYIDQYSNSSLIKWVNEYEKCKICLNLMSDAEQVTDDQLKFICFSRALEVFHKEFFIDNDEASNVYMEELHDFITVNSIGSPDRQRFIKSKLTLSHRLYDLARYVYPIISDKSFRLVFGHIIMKDRIQQLADTRNYLIHFSESKKTKAWKEEELHHLNFNLFMMLKVLLLKRFGFTDKAIHSVVHMFYRNYFGL